MKFCTNCGAQLDDGIKFCTECGQKTEPAATPAPEGAAADVHVYGQPVAHPFSPPSFTESKQGVVHTYGAPVSHSFTPPVQAESAVSGTYGGASAPAPKPAAPAPEPAPVPAPAPEPVRQPEYVPAPPVAQPPSAAPAAAAREKKAALPKMPSGPKREKAPGQGGKKKSRLVLAAVLVLALAVGLFACIGGGGEDDDPNLGLYNAVSCSYGGFEMDAEGEWIDLKSGGKLEMLLLNEEYSGKWELEGEKLTVTQAGDTYLGTLSEGVITLDLGGLIYTYEKEGGAQPQDSADSSAQGGEAAATEPAPSEVGSWTLKYAEGDSELAMDEETVQLLKEMGIEITVVIKADGTGTFTMEEPISFTVADGTLVAEDGSAITYALEGEELILTMEGARMHFVRADAAAHGAGSGSKSGPVTYVGVSGNVNGTQLNDSALLQLGNVTVSFNGDGTGSMDILGQAGKITYDDTTITRDGLSMAYTMDGETMHLKMSDSVSFVLEPRYAATDYTREDLTTDDLGYWDGDYYGWWVIDNVIRGNSEVQGNWWDCCMTLKVYPDGSGHILIWDEDYGKDDPIAQVDISISVQGGVARIVSEKGQFMGDAVEHADWLFYSDSTDYENTLGFFAPYEDDSMKLDCYFFLRRWGTRWDDVEEKDMPAYYDSWYLPLIEGGVTTAPDAIG